VKDTQGCRQVSSITKEAGAVPDPCIVVIFGASGDLTKRKLLPALFT
jgi:glucose-6-phosphate 1-dehydrogenase